MYCRNCGCKIDRDDKFCSACGQAQVHKGENAITSYNIENNNNVNQTSMEIRTKKNKRKKYIILLLLIVMVIIVFRSGIISQDFIRFALEEFPEGAAIASEEEKLLGNWKGKDEEGEIGYIKFENDYKFEITYPKKNRSMSGIYLIADANTINLYPTKVDGEIPEERIEIKDKCYFKNENTLVMNHQGVSTIFKRTETDNVGNSKNVEINSTLKTTKNINSKSDVAGRPKHKNELNTNKLKTYSQNRFEFCISYPSDYILLTDISDNGDGIKIYSKDKEVEIIATGCNNSLEEDVNTYYNWSIEDKNNIAYKVIKDNWFVISWIEGGRIKYQKTIVGKGSENTLIISYPENKKNYYDSLVSTIVSNFKTPGIEQAH